MAQPAVADLDAEVDGTRGHVAALVLAAVTLLTIGQATALAGILLPAAFIPGAVVIALGFLVLTVAGILGVWPRGSAPPGTLASAKRAG